MKLKLKTKSKNTPVENPPTKKGEYKNFETKKGKAYSFRLNNLVDAEIQKKANELGVLPVKLIQSILAGYAEGLNKNLVIK